MRRAVRGLGLAALVALAALGVFLVPTLWGKPWRIEHFYLRVFAEIALERPQLLSRLRILEPWGLDWFSDDLDDQSVAFTDHTARLVESQLARLRSYERAAQSEAQLLSTDVLDAFLAFQVEGARFRFHDYPVNQMNGIQNELPDFMLNVHQITSQRDAEAYLARLSKFGVAFDQVIAGLAHRESLGVLPPRFVLERVLDGVKGFLAPPPAEHVLATDFAARLEKVAGLSEAERAQLRAGVEAEIERTVYPAYRRLAVQLAGMRERARTDDGVWRLPDGEAFYDWAVRLHTTTDRTPAEIHERGLAEVARIQAEMREILRAEGIPGADLAKAIRGLGRDPRFLFPDTDEGREQVLAGYRAIIEDANTRLPALFGRLPRARVAVERVPPFKEEGAARAYYDLPPFDGSKPGIFYANLRHTAEHPKFGMRTLAYHEAIPGHHLQIALAQELEGVPFFRRVVPFTAFIEGWALYAERLAAEQGFHPTAFDRLGQLVAEVFRAARLVVDTGIHAKRWTREQAIGYMAANTGMEPTEVVAEVERYIVMPGQALAYKTGQLEILDLRERARRELGDRFDLREFHDLVLGSGALPLTLLSRNVDAWIAARRGS
ncbi:MAG TPA: DUF885 domain-containing protein [Myxococcota bacterium]|jgi:uncharacterized protein (DUF885 family)